MGVHGEGVHAANIGVRYVAYFQAIFPMSVHPRENSDAGRSLGLRSTILSGRSSDPDRSADIVADSQ